jgi:toxin FitB
MSILLDTNVLSELLRAQPDEGVLDWFAAQAADSLFVSTVTQAEMMLGARLMPAGKRRQSLEQALDAMFSEDFASRLLPFDAAAVPEYVKVVAMRRKVGKPISQFDAQIAAIAASRRMSVASRNTVDFEGCGFKAPINPWVRP